MNEKQALSIMHELKETHEFTKEQKEALAVAEQAIRKNIPIKVSNLLHTYEGKYGKCPVCDKHVDSYRNGGRCACGQALNWDE